MKKLTLCVAALLALSASPYAQDPPAPGPVLRLQVVFGRYENEKKVSTVPYTLSLIPNAPGKMVSMARIRMGVQVPLRMDTTGPDKKPVPGNVVYKDVGNSADCTAETRDDRRFLVFCSFEQSSVASQTSASAGASAPLLRTFRSEARLVLGDGQTGQHSVGTDPTTGEQLRIDITLNVVK